MTTSSQDDSWLKPHSLVIKCELEEHSAHPMLKYKSKSHWSLFSALLEWLTCLGKCSNQLFGTFPWPVSRANKAQAQMRSQFSLFFSFPQKFHCFGFSPTRMNWCYIGGCSPFLYAYSVPWFSRKFRVFITKDHSYHVRISRWATFTPRDLVLAPDNPPYTPFSGQFFFLIARVSTAFSSFLAYFYFDIARNNNWWNFTKYLTINGNKIWFLTSFRPTLTWPKHGELRQILKYLPGRIIRLYDLSISEKDWISTLLVHGEKKNWMFSFKWKHANKPFTSLSMHLERNPGMMADFRSLVEIDQGLRGNLSENTFFAVVECLEFTSSHLVA